MPSDASKSLVGSSAAHFVNDGALAFFPLLYPILASNYFLSTVSISVLASLLYLVSIVVSPMIGRKLDQTRRRGELLSLGVFLLSFGILGYSLTPSLFNGIELLTILIPVTVVAGFGSALYHPIASTILRDTWGNRRHGRAMGINGAFGSFGRAVFPLITTFLLATAGVPSLLELGVASILVSAFVLVVFGRISLDASVPASSKSAGNPRFSTLGILKIVRTLMIVSFSKGIVAQGLVAFIPYFLINVDHFSLAYSGLIFSLVLGAGIIFQPLLGYLADRYGRVLILQVSNVGCVVFVALFLLTKDPALVGIFLFGFGALGLTGFPLLLGLSAFISPKETTTEANSLVWGVAYTGGIAASPIIIATLAEPSLLGSFQSSFFVAVAFGLVSVALTPLVRRPKIVEVDQA